MAIHTLADIRRSRRRFPRQNRRFSSHCFHLRCLRPT